MNRVLVSLALLLVPAAAQECPPTLGDAGSDAGDAGAQDGAPDTTCAPPAPPPPAPLPPYFVDAGAPPPFTWIVEGDSISDDGHLPDGAYTGPPAWVYPTFVHYLVGSAIGFRDFAVSGSTIAGAEARAPLVDQAIGANVEAGAPVVFSIFLGTNDLPASGGDASGFCASLVDYTRARIAAGASLALVLTSYHSQNTNLAEANDCIRANAASAGYVVVDVAADPAFVDDTDTRWVRDLSHPTDNGHVRIGELVRSALVDAGYLPGDHP